jgi:hypothetical protein
MRRQRASPTQPEPPTYSNEKHQPGADRHRCRAIGVVKAKSGCSRIRSTVLFPHSNGRRSSFRVLRDVPVVKLDSVPDEDSLEASEVGESLLQVGNPMWLPANVRVHRNRHYFHALETFLV